MIRNLEVIGEACSNIPDPLRDQYARIPWRKIIGLRNVVIHHYFGVDPETVWFIITRQLPELREQIEKMRRTLKPPENE